MQYVKIVELIETALKHNSALTHSLTHSLKAKYGSEDVKKL